MAKPKMMDQKVLMLENARAFSGNALQGAYDADGDTMTVARIDDALVGGNKGKLSFTGDYGTLEINPDGSYTYTLFEGLNIPAGQVLVEGFKVKIRDGAGNYDQGYLKFEVTGQANNRPVAVDDKYSFASDTVVGNVLANDSDPDGDTLHVGGVIDLATGTNYHITGLGPVEIEGKYGTLTISDDGSFTYTVDLTDPDTVAAGFVGVEKFAYKPHDGQNGQGNNTDYALLTFSFDATGEVVPV